jgi:predicted enzyme related to lactoylglutathione lyase
MFNLRDRHVAAVMPQQSADFNVIDADATVKAIQDAGGQVLTGPMDVMDQGRIALFPSRPLPMLRW